jgi:uncharacterized protein YuzE
MKITHHEESDLLYISFDENPPQVINRRVDDDIVLDLAEGDRIVGIEILDASKRLRLDEFLTLEYRKTP